MPKVIVDSISFLEAVSHVPKMKRGPRGGRGHIPKDTLISPAGDYCLSVETPAVSTLVKTEGVWDIKISIDAALLHNKTSKLLNTKKGIPNIGTLQLFMSDGMLHIKGLTEFSLPLFEN